MNFNKHLKLEGQHALLSASKHYWVNYSDEKLQEFYRKAMAVEMGTRLHAFAKEAIELGQKLPKTAKTLNMYVNDAIGFKMTPEQVLYYSDNAFGTADAICFRNNFLRIHDLKTGETKASMTQLEIYMAFFCLEYKYKPNEIDAELRIYQNNAVEIETPHPDDIFRIMDKIVEFDKLIETMKAGG